jgi:lactate dehydrogenase-like 2-hydroxyacid dehydrogenase
MLRDKGFTLDVSEKDGVLTQVELLSALRAKPYDGVLCLLTDTINGAVFDAVPSAKIFANYAVGFNNIDVPEAKKRGITITNTPGALTNTVAEHAMALILAVATRSVEGDRLVRAGKYEGWGPMMLLGTDLKGKTLGVLGAGRIGSRLAYHCQKGFDMNVIYYDVKQNPDFEKETGATFYPSVEGVLEHADVVSIHVPLLDSTKHLINADRLALMKKSAYLINTSRGPVVDEVALVDALKKGKIAGAGLDVYENEPRLASGLTECESAVLTPHIASATETTRGEMARLAAENLIAYFEGRTPPNQVQ